MCPVRVHCAESVIRSTRPLPDAMASTGPEAILGPSPRRSRPCAGFGRRKSVTRERFGGTPSRPQSRESALGGSSPGFALPLGLHRGFPRAPEHRVPGDAEDGLRADADGDLQSERDRRGGQTAQVGQTATPALDHAGRAAKRRIVVRARVSTQLRVTRRETNLRPRRAAGAISGEFAAWDLLDRGFGRSCRFLRGQACPDSERRHRIHTGDAARRSPPASRSALRPVAGVRVVQWPRQRWSFADRRRASAPRCPRSGCGGSRLPGCSDS